MPKDRIGVEDNHHMELVNRGGSPIGCQRQILKEQILAATVNGSKLSEFLLISTMNFFQISQEN